MSKFYDGSGLLSRSKYKIFFSLGGRNIGKSTFWQRFIINHFIKRKEKFGIIVKYKDDLSTFAANYFSQEWMNKWFPNYEILYKRGKYYIRRALESYDDNTQGWQQCGYAVALNMNASLKSTTTFQDIDNILFEEFMPLEDKYIGSAKDPEKEPKLLESVYQTIARGNKDAHTRYVRLICISNNYTMNNPYFTYYKILDMVSSNPNSVFQQFYTYDKDDLHYALEFSQLDPEMTGIEASEDSTGVRFCDFRNELKIVKNIKNRKPYMQLTFDDKYFINICNHNNSVLCFKSDKVECDTVYSCSKFKTTDKMGMYLFKKSPIYNQFKSAYESNDLYYDSLQTFIQLTNILAW